jgi:hypothetical protein
MKKLFLLTSLLFINSLSATTIYYNGEGDDVGAWVIRPGSIAGASITEVYDLALRGNVMEFTEEGIYRLQMPNNQWWNNTDELMLSVDVNFESTFTLDVLVNTTNGVRRLFYNRLNINAGHHNNTVPIGDDGTRILCAIGHDRLLRAGDLNSGWENHPEHRDNRNGWVRLTMDLQRQLQDTEPDNNIISVLSLRVQQTDGRIDNVTLDAPNRTTRATQANDWTLTPNTPAGGTVAVVQDNPARGDVIEIDGAVGSNSFTTGAREGANAWNDTVNDSIQWKLQTEDPYKVIVHVNTDNGLRDMVYYGGKRRGLSDRWWEEFGTPNTPIESRGFDEQTNEIFIGMGIRRHLGDASPDSDDEDTFPDYDFGTGPTWQTFTRNLDLDVAEFENGNTLVSINGVTIIGTNTFEHDSPMIDSTIRVDDVQLFASIEPTINESPYDVRRWRLREESVRVSFADNAEGETGFRFVNVDTGEQMGAIRPPLAGREGVDFQQLNGLQPATTYTIRVDALFNDGRATTQSVPVTFTTLGEPPLVDLPANDLHFWRRRATSVRISFTDNANDEAGFRYINADTGEQMGNDLPATAGTGASSIEQINNLIPATTYHVRVDTFFNDGRATVPSAILEFTTLGNPPPVANEAATNLNPWARRDNSIRISFIDHANGEIGFRYINADTGEQMGNDLAPLAGIGEAGIGQIDGLTAGDTYRVQVQTRFNDGRANVLSNPLVFVAR